MLTKFPAKYQEIVLTGVNIDYGKGNLEKNTNIPFRTSSELDKVEGIERL
jgi:hypothetical protein